MNVAAAAQYRAHQHGSAHEIVERHSELVRRIAHHLAARLPASVEIDDLIQAGMLGLIDAARNFQADQGAAFETYASIRIRGAMIDEIRRGDWVPRSVHRRYRDLVAATRDIEQRTGKATPARAFESDAFRQALGGAIEQLPEREQLVLSLYYEQELNLREIGAVLSVSESRVCQIHGQAMVRLRARLGEWRGGRDDEDDDLP